MITNHLIANDLGLRTNLYVGGYGVTNDEDSGLLYMRARYYDPTVGRFITRDPIEDYPEYTYCINNPLNSMDPLGLTVFHIRGKDANFDWAIHFSLKRIGSVPKGEALLRDIKSKYKEVTIEYIEGVTKSDAPSKIIQIDPSLRQDIDVWVRGTGFMKIPASLDRKLAHELGHFMTAPNGWGPMTPQQKMEDQMKTITLFENPIMRQLGEPYIRWKD